MTGRRVLSYAETLPLTTPTLSAEQTRWLLAGHVRRSLQFLAVLGVIVLYIVSRRPDASTDSASGATRARTFLATLLSRRLPQRETTLLSYTLWRDGVAQVGEEALVKLATDPTLAAFLGDSDHTLNLHETTKTVGTGPNIMRLLGVTTSGGQSRNRATQGGKFWTVVERPLLSVARTKPINNFKEKYRIISRNIV